ncbi:alpha-galactosidase [Mediterraneibacter sp. NSJ-151]|uniref:alpha-galactosidase n=1 Tax=Mediterraneibacter sp. NSJ-151 TaxID=2897708 RepID=UPI001F0A88B6|nr:alpha-galactosidase [Mediterraneibacter sp. NSJ-151]MCH4280718.1 alpha-galactosidase [Mediterraneibacter sp. NSJ-151]
MGIIYCEKDRTFTLQTKNTTYQMQVDQYGFLLHLYYGKKIEGCMDYLLTHYDRGFSGNPYDAGEDRTYSMDTLPQEFPCYGNGDFRSTALVVENADGSMSCDLRYKSHTILKGKYNLEGLPAVYASDEEAQTLEILMEDQVTGVKVILLYGVLSELDIITRSVCIKNGNNGKIYLNKIESASLDFLYGDYELLTFYGRHAMERNVQRVPVVHGTQKIGSVRGTSSHQYNPMMILAERETTEDKGNCYAMSFVYSGCFQGEVLKDQLNQTRMMLGLQEKAFRYPLEKNEMFKAPEVILSYSSRGMNQLSQNLHQCIRKHICRGKYKEQVRPVLINSWEASYFDFTGDTIYELAKAAKEVNIDMLVMDDGWFGKRDDDNSGLGDWFVNEKKLGGTLGNLIERINALGVKFGIWIEPEMVSEDSELYRKHPDWALTIPGRRPVRSRNQLVLDFSRKEVVDEIYSQICKVLDQGNIEYVKWDMNRSLMDIYSATTKDQGRVLHDYVLGLYDFLERLVQRYPNLLIEGCSGGGGRFDAGMMYYTPQIWCSDNTDAIDRLQIQYGTSFGYPVSVVGSHVSAVPNHQTGRKTPLHTRGVVAMSGTFGYELNLMNLSEEEKQEIREQIAEYKSYAPIIQNGLYYRLSNPTEEEICAWEFVYTDEKEQSKVLLNIVMQAIHGNMTVNYVKLQGLEEAAVYREEKSGKRYTGSALMYGGMPLPVELGEYQAYQYCFVRE